MIYDIVYLRPLGLRLVLAQAARYPTVPHGDGLLRFGLTALHTRPQLLRAVDALAEAWACPA